MRHLAPFVVGSALVSLALVTGVSNRFTGDRPRLLAASPQAAQDPATQNRPVFRAGVDVVQLEVFVTDRDRHAIHGLTMKDFTVTEDGKPQEVVAADEVVLQENDDRAVWDVATRPDTVTNDIDDRRLLAIVMDDMHCCSAAGGATDTWAMANAIKAANDIVDGLGPHDLATVALTHDIAPLQDFTSDHTLLRDAIRRFEPASEMQCMPRIRQTLVEDLADLLGLASAPMKAVIVLTSVNQVVGSGMPCAEPSYRIPDTGEVVTKQASGSNSGPLDLTRLGPVPIYRFNISGLVAPAFGRPRQSCGPMPFPQRLPPLVCSHNGPNVTGGQDVIDTNDLKPAIAGMLDENQSYYAIGFKTSRPTTDGHYRRIDIHVNRPGATVRTRDGYYRPRDANPKGRAPDPAIPIASQTVVNLLPHGEITMHATAAPFASPDRKGGLLAVTVDIDHLLSDAPASRVESIDLRTVAYADGDPKYDRSTTAAVPLDVGSSRVHSTLQAVINVVPGRYELWLTAHDARTNRLGSVTYDLDVPDFAAQSISLSGIVLGRSAAGAESAPAPNSPLASLVPFVPMVDREFGREQSVTAFLRVYQGSRGTVADAVVTRRVLDAGGTTVVDQSDTITADRFASGSADERFTMPLSNLSPGRYLLTVEAKAGERISPKRDVPFTVK